MKKFMKIAAALMSAVMLFTSVPVLAAETDEAAASETVTSPFKDVDVNTQTGKNILKLYKTGVIAGYEDGTFRPDGNITRAELVRIFNQVFKYKPTAEQLANVENFLDNKDEAAWYYNDVRIAQIAGYINGFEDNTFRGKENFTRQQACVVIDLITGVNTYDPELVVEDEVSEWAVKYVNWALTAGLFPLEEGNTFRATQNITRAEVCNLLEIFVEEPKQSEGGTEETTSEGKDEETTEEVTVKTANGTVVKITKGGSGGGGSSSSGTVKPSSQTTTSAATTEATTESTTAASSGSEKKTSEATTKAPEKTTEKATETTTKAPVVESTTEATTELVVNQVDRPSADTLSRLENVYVSLQNYIIPKCSTAAEKAVAKQIRDSISRYITDHSYDIKEDALSAQAAYKALSAEEKADFKELIIGYCSVNDLFVLKDTFFPDLEYHGSF